MEGQGTSQIPSCQRKLAGGFTFEVQQLLAEDLSGGLEVKALAWRMVVDCDEGIELLVGYCCEIGVARQEAAYSADGVFDAALLPGGMGVAEEGGERRVVQVEVA